ncbi:coiled-coil alpha-helical rod protein 1 isoform X3 [Parambassis ranga]|uniref:Coiled-coil alpha-helical rod protein 1 n=1 Tax=Parambassis ranga TaxID=210632 RepID=A0A6P7JNB6_9TELE|nr:coiled-coil alpha-helical rod protein 1-like isoform X3 [Parambassis ranga]
MERHNLAKEKLIVPTDFTSPAASKTIQEDLIPPSHFASSIQSAGAHRGVQTSTAPPAMSWINPGVTSGPSVDPSPVSPWLAISQAQQEILELRNENQRIMMLQGESMRGRTSGDPLSHLRTRHTGESEQWARWESEWRLEAEKHMAKAERLKGQVESLKETAERYREEMRDKDITLNRHCNELEAMREEISKSKTELSQMREELNLSNVQKEKIRSQLERLKAESSEEITKLRGDVENSKEESRELALSAEMCKMQAEEEARQQTLRLSEQLKEMQKKQEVEIDFSDGTLRKVGFFLALKEVKDSHSGPIRYSLIISACFMITMFAFPYFQLQCLNASHCAELSAVRKANKDLQDRLQSMTSEVLQLKSTLMDVSTERDGLKNHLSKMGQAFETQSATLHSLRNYIGQLAPEKGDKDQLNETVEKLTKEKAALQMTTELLTVRLNSVNEILALQEEKMVKKASTDPLVKNGLEGLQVLQLWREKVFKLCVQLRSKDIELRGEKDKLVSELRSMEQQLQQEHHRANVLQHSLHDRIAELDLERVGKETLKQDLAKAYRENAQLTSQNQKTKAELTTLTEAVQSFSQAFQSKVAEVDAAKSRLNTFTQRLTFAKRRVETIQGLVMRKVALQKVEQACKQSEKAAYSIRNLQAEHSLVCEERDKLAQELKRTPELIEKTLADLKEQYESKVRQQQQELEQSWEKVRQAVAQREETEQSLQQIQVQLEESKVNLEKLHCELLSQKELSEQALLERVSEIEYRCAEKLREMELQVNTARREHTKAVMTLRQFERGRTQNEMEERTQNQSTKRGALNAQLKETAKDKNLLETGDLLYRRNSPSTCR